MVPIGTDMFLGGRRAGKGYRSNMQVENGAPCCVVLGKLGLVGQLVSISELCALMCDVCWLLGCELRLTLHTLSPHPWGALLVRAAAVFIGTAITVLPAAIVDAAAIAADDDGTW